MGGWRACRASGTMPLMATPVIRILGIDPGLRRTGWGVIESSGSRLGFRGCGVILSDDSLSLAERLVMLHEGLAAVIAEHRPDEAAVEETFVNTNPSSTLKLGQARGVALLVPAQAGLVVAEYAANLVKKSVVGSGHADKTQIQHMIRVLLPTAQAASADAADALAVAVTHAHHRTIRALAGVR
jgi:crossover junction endodeoxyribonuclease RuvC